MQGPRAHGWDNDLWTSARVVEIIKRHFGIAYHPEHVRVSAISAITLTPRRYLPDLKFRLLPAKENFNAERIVEFMQQLRGEMPRFTVVWDRSRIHSRSKAVKAYLAEHPEIVAEDFPGYAPELNPDEMVWCWTKYGRMCNWAAPDVGALRFVWSRSWKPCGTGRMNSSTSLITRDFNWLRDR